MINPRY